MTTRSRDKLRKATIWELNTKRGFIVWWLATHRRLETGNLVTAMLTNCPNKCQIECQREQPNCEKVGHPHLSLLLFGPFAALHKRSFLALFFIDHLKLGPGTKQVQSWCYPSTQAHAPRQAGQRRTHSFVLGF